MESGLRVQRFQAIKRGDDNTRSSVNGSDGLHHRQPCVGTLLELRIARGLEVEMVMKWWARAFAVLSLGVLVVGPASAAQPFEDELQKFTVAALAGHVAEAKAFLDQPGFIGQ